MCPQRFVPEAYDPNKLHVLQQVFDQIWERVVLEHPNREPSRDDEVRTELAREIVAYASTGISDPDELGKWALKSLRHVGLLR